MKNSRFNRSLTAKWPGVVFVAIIFTVLFIWIFDWVVDAAKTSSDEKSHNEVGYLASAQPVPETYAAIIRDVFNGRSRKFKDLNMYPFRSGLANPRLFDYHGTTNNFVLSYDNGPTLQEISAQSENDLVPRNFLSERGLSEPKSLTTNRGENAEFHFGDVFLGFEKGTIVLLSGDQTEITTFSLRSEVSDVDGGLAINDTGAFGHELIAVVRSGRIWRVDAFGNSKLVTDLNTAVSGLAIIPDDLEHFGPIAGKIIVGAPGQKGIYSIDRTGRASFYPLDVEPRDIVRINPNENLFAISGKSGTLWGIDSANSKIGYGDIVVATKEPGKVFLLRWGGTQLKLSGLTIDESVDQIISAPIAVRPDSAPCVASITPNQNTFQWQGGSGSYSVVAPANCSWTSSSDSPWVQITSGQNGTGNGTVSYVVGKNSFSVLRQANLSVDSLVHKVLQSRKALSQCYLTTSSANPTIAAAGGSGALNIVVNSECAWSAVSDSPWLTLNENSGFGNGTISYTAVPNFTAQSRKAIISFPGIPSEPATVTQLPNQAPGVKAGRPQTISIPNTAFLEGRAADDGVGNPVTTSWSKVSGPESVIFSEAGNPISTAIFSKEGTYLLRLTASDGYLTSSDKIQITVLPDPVPPPPDPITIAPPLNGTVTTNIATATKFLYTGPNAIQTGVDPANIKAERISLVHGRVIGRNNAPISNVVISVLDHPEFGQTKSRADGKFDFVVNGGGDLTLKYEKQGFITLQREEKIDWQTYDMSDDVVMITYDPSVAAIDLSAAIPVQVASGSTSNDSSGQRRPQLFFKQGTTASAVLPNGSTQPLVQLHVRSTEFTVGDNGRNAMPGDLPPTSEYTYATEYSVDEAVALNATNVSFSKSVIQYLENFIGFPVGTSVPTGSFDRKTASWVPERSGKVVKVLSITAGAANLDLAGNGQPATDAEYLALGIDAGERQKLAELYVLNQTLWRVPLDHFSSWDCNYPPADRPPPDVAPPVTGKKPKKECDEHCGIKEGKQSQTVSETIEISHTGYEITYGTQIQLDYVEGIAAIPLVGPTPLPPDLEHVGAFIHVAGRDFQTPQLTPSPNLTYNFAWDGNDYAGRRVQGPQKATVQIIHLYPIGYTLTDEFGQPGTGTGPTFVRTGAGITTRSFEIELGHFDQGRMGLGGWSFNVHHVYDPVSQTLFEGGGREVHASSTSSVVNTTAGNGTPDFGGDGGPALNAKLFEPSDVAFAPDGSYYIADRLNNRIRRVSTMGIITTFAGDGTENCPTPACGDGGQALSAQLHNPTSVAVAPDSSVLVSDTNGNRIRRIDTNGVITTIAGNGVDCDPTAACGDGGPATAANLNQPQYIHLAQDGSLYIADAGSHRVRKVGTNGKISTVAGSGNIGCPSDNMPARTACLEPTGMALSGNGSLYITGNGQDNARIFRLGTDGLIRVLAKGDLCNGARPEDGTPSLCNPRGITIGPDDNPYFAADNRIFKIDSSGALVTGAGTLDNGYNGEGQPVLKANFSLPASATFAPDGNMYIAAANDHRIRKATATFPGFSGTNVLIPSEDGTEVFEFDADGRHLRTLNALTGTNKYVFGYSAAGNLTSITDGDNDVTTIERDAAGKPTGIRSPYGDLTTLTLDANGYLASVANPAGEANRYTYSSGGLMLTKRDPLNHQNTFTYDADGRLIRNDNAGAGFNALTRTGAIGNYNVASKTALNRTTNYQVTNASNGDETLVNTFPDGSKTQVVTRADGSTTGTDAQGTVSDTTLGPDPRWGMQAPITQVESVTSPGGRSFRGAFDRIALLSNPTDPFSLTQQTETLDLNGNVYSGIFTAANKTILRKSPLNRQLSLTIDSQERVIGRKYADLNSSSYLFDSHGRIKIINFGSGVDLRSTGFGYDPFGALGSITDPLNRVLSFTHDGAGRTTRQTLPDNRFISYSYDADGNMTSLTPPGRAAHIFGLDVRDRLATYTAPSVGGNSQTAFTYDLEDQLTRITRPDGQQINFGFDNAGKRTSLAIPAGTYTYAYNATSGSLASISSPGGLTLSFAQDGPLLTGMTWGGPVSGSISNTYDDFFRLASEGVNNAQAVDFVYDADGLLTNAGDLTISRNAQNGLITGTAIGSATDARVYDAFGGRTNYTVKFNNSDVFAENLTFDKQGCITQKTETINGVTLTYGYGYDPTGRLTSFTIGGAPQPFAIYGYDANNNRTSSNFNGSVTTASYDAQDRMTQYGGTTYSYSLAGDLQSKTAGGQTTQYGYDAIGNLRNVTLPNGTAIQYLIDGLNRRVGKKVAGVQTQAFLYRDSLKPVAELDGNNAVVSRFVYGTRSNVPEYMIKGGVTYRLIADYLGSVRMVVNVSTGAVAQRLDYDEFGVVLQDTNPGFQPFGFAGGLFDPQTRLTRFGARDYDAETGRWTTKDPLLFASSVGNVYEYAKSDPVNFIDLNGMKGGGSGVSPGVDGVNGSPTGIATDSIRVIDKMKKVDGNRAGNLQKQLKYFKDRLTLIEKTIKIKKERLEVLKERMRKFCEKYPKAPLPDVIVNERTSLEIQIKDLETERTALQIEYNSISTEIGIDDGAVPAADAVDKGTNLLDPTWWASQFGRLVSGQKL